jgi:hypothetical protein
MIKVEPLELRASDPTIKELDFETYRYKNKRQAEQFLPNDDQQQIIRVQTGWGGVLTGKRGDYLVNEVGNPDEKWVVEKEIFVASYQEVEVGIFIKKATVDLVPLSAVTRDPEREVIVYSLEGPLKVRAKDFYLALGIKDEIWPVPIEHVSNNLELVK